MPLREVVEPASFGDRLSGTLSDLGPLCMGIDPSSHLLARWGLPDSGDGLRLFGEAVVEAARGTAAVVKPQVAFYERHGSAGFAALEKTIESAKQAGLLVLADAKRGDIGSTSEAYAAAWLKQGSPLEVDAVTATAYLGLAALTPMFEMAQQNGKGVIVVVQSSNPEGLQLQNALLGSDVTVAGRLLG